jgi:outer membrane protein TolC
MKKNKLIKLWALHILVTMSPALYAQDQLTEEPQVLDVKKSEVQTEVVSEPANSSELESTATKVEDPGKLNLEELPLDTKVESDAEKANQKKNTVLTEEDLLKPLPKKATKASNSSINESEIYISESDKYKMRALYKPLRLNDVIEQGLRKSYDQELRNKKEELTELTFDGVKRKFWYPTVKLVLSTDEQLISLLGSSKRKVGTNNPKTPTGSFGLVFDDYTFFNWGKDYAQYLINRSSYEREKESYNESKRELKLDLIYRYFNLVSNKNIEKIFQDKLRQASFVYRLNKEKLAIGKAAQQDYYQSRNEYLSAQSEFHQAKMNTDIADENMAYLLTDEVGTKYLIDEGLDFKKIKLNLLEAISMAQSKNPTLLNNKTTLINAERSYDIAQKDNLPLPKFTINLGAYEKKFGPATNKTTYETYTGNGNIELVATVNATWDLTGDNGLLNSNKLAKSRINREIANFELNKNKHYTESQVQETYKNILAYQNQMLILDAKIPSMQKSFDIILDNYLSGKTKYNDFHIALDEISKTRIYLETIKLNHLVEKLNLAKLIGVDDFPGENFEHLAIKIKAKGK